MANATVGEAMGAARPRGAMERADVTLMADRLSTPVRGRAQPEARSVYSAERLRETWYRRLLWCGTILGIDPTVAVHEGSTLLVVFNSLRLLAYHDPIVTEADDPIMKRHAVLFFGVAILFGCDRSRDVAVPAGDDGLHGHPMPDVAVRTSIGRVSSVDTQGGTLTVVLAKGRSRQHADRGVTQTLDATAAQLARVRIGDVVEFKSTVGRPRARLVTIDSHGHGGSVGP